MTISLQMSRTIAFAVVAVCVAAVAAAQSPSNAWLDEPEAAFMTNAERQEWWTLASDADRDAFKQRYWLRRDPTPGTPKNEFRDLLMQRIATADQKFTLNNRERGSMTWRGQVYLIFGTPARVSSFQENGQGQPLGTAEIQNPNSIAVTGNEATERWFYERSRTPKILEAVGLPSLDFTFVIEPVKQIDDLQNPGNFHKLRDVVAQKTIVTQLAEPARATAITTTQELTPDVVSALDHAAESGAAARSSILWTGESAAATFWLVAPNVSRADGALSLFGRVKDMSGNTVATIARGVDTAGAFSTQQSGGIVADATVQLTPGEYDAAFLLESEKKVTLATGTTHVIVPESQSQFAVSSLVLTDKIQSSGEGLAMGRARVRPRADATFTTAESMWYLFQVANPSDPAKVTVAVRLRHGVAAPTSPTVLPASLESIGAGRYVSGFEMPLSQLVPGDYTLYVSVRDPAGREDVVRRADFRVVEAPRVQ
jgi:GWxTD domain-containing protein